MSEATGWGLRPSGSCLVERPALDALCLSASGSHHLLWPCLLRVPAHARLSTRTCVSSARTLLGPACVWLSTSAGLCPPRVGVSNRVSLPVSGCRRRPVCAPGLCPCVWVCLTVSLCLSVQLDSGEDGVVRILCFFYPLRPHPHPQVRGPKFSLELCLGRQKPGLAFAPAHPCWSHLGVCLPPRPS